MALPTIDELLGQIGKFAEEESLEVSRKARQQMDNLGYTDPVVCDILFALVPEDCEKVAESHWGNPNIPVGTFRCPYRPAHRDSPDDLFIEVAVLPDRLYLLACKLNGSPQ